MQLRTLRFVWIVATVIAFGLARVPVAHARIDDDSLAVAITSPSGPSVPVVWSAAAVHSFSRFSSDRPSWRHEALIVRRHVRRQSTYDFEAGQVHRHGERDPYAAVDLYRTFGRRSYGNLRLAVAPGADVTPRSDVYVEGFHTVRIGWELSAGYRRADYASNGTNTWSVGVARYVGNWYLRVRPSATQVERSLGYAVLATVRRYAGAGGEFIGLTVASGREVVAFPGVEGVDARNSRSASLQYQRRIAGSTGIRLGAEVVDDGDLSRWGITTGVVWYW